MLLDPRDPARFTAAERERTRIDLRYEDLGPAGYGADLVRARGGDRFVFGPLAYRPGAAVQLTDFADRMALVRGVDMRSVAHETAYRYALTAEFPEGSRALGSSLGTTLTALGRPERPVPQLSLGVESYNDRHPSRWSALRASDADELLTVLAPDRSTDPATRDALDAYAAEATAEVYNRRGLVDRLREARRAAGALAREDVARPLRALVDDSAEATALRARYGLARGEIDGPRARAAMASLALKSGLSQVVVTSIAPGMDTHFAGNAAHARLLGQGLELFVALLTDLRDTPHPGGGSMLDHTTVLAFSEFARYPVFNSYGGKDHHSASSYLLVGAGIRGGAVVGATSDVGMVAMPWDLTADRSAPEGVVLTPAHLGATVAAAAGLDPEGFGVPPLWGVLA
jgi:hypothetical protein